MPILVMKFGGTSVATLDRIRRAAKRVGREVANGYDVIVIVSAMAGKTNELVGWVEETSPLFDAREYDAVVSSGENVTAGLMALTLQEMDVPARSWQGWQVPVRRPRPCLGPDRGDPARQHHGEVRRGHARGGRRGLPGDQPRGPHHHAGPRRVGHHRGGLRRRLRGGALRHLHRCGRGLYHRPADHHKARKLDRIAFEEMLELASLGAKVLQTRSVELAMRYKREAAGAVELRGNERRRGHAGLREEDIMESNAVAGVAYSRDEAKMTLTRWPTAPASPRRSSARWRRPA
jgi:aspartate kinase